jgi:cyclopropane fatty-acyl-phospholipid synthase-like methyltransferase
MSDKDSGWWDDFFPEFRPFFGLASRKATNAHVRYVIEKLNLKPGKKFLDCPCGIGTVGMPMAKKGIKVTGVDITQSYLDEFETKARQRSLKVDLYREDMRRIDFNSEFDAAGNLGTSFGYFEKESDNSLTIKKIYQALKPGGKFLLHVINRDWIMAHYQSHDWQEIAGVKSISKRYFDYSTSINHGTWYFIRDGKEKVFKVSLRMYSYHELIALFKKVGFVDIEGFGSTNNEPISREHIMMYVSGIKPKRR